MGANDHILTTTQPMSDVLQSAVTKAIGMTLSDRSGGSILMDPAISAGFLSGTQLMGALAMDIVDVAWGADKLASVAEGASMTILDLASKSASVTPARMGYARVVSDMARLLDGMDVLAWARFAMDGTIGWQQSMVTLLASVFTSFSAAGGNSGGAASWGVVVDAMNTLGIAGVPGPYTYITRPKDWAACVVDSLSLGGAVAQSPETYGSLIPQNPGFKGTYLNGSLRVYTTDDLSTAGGDTVSGMFGAGAINWDAAVPTPSPATIPLIRTPLWMAEMGREVLESEDTIAFSTHAGASIGPENARGIKLLFGT